MIRRAELADIPTIQTIAEITWPAAYGDIISQEQISYMLRIFYSKNSLINQWEDGHFFIIDEIENQAAGFASYSIMKNGNYRLHKLYVLPNFQKKGSGKRMIDFIIKASKDKTTMLELNVNRRNTALQYYLKLGFEIISTEDIDIGNGMWMNDYVLGLKL